MPGFGAVAGFKPVASFVDLRFFDGHQIALRLDKVFLAAHVVPLQAQALSRGNVSTGTLHGLFRYVSTVALDFKTAEIF